MKNLLAGGVLILAFSISSLAKILPVSLNEAVSKSDLIIVGTLTEVSEKTEHGAPFGDVIYGQGKIVVGQFIAGNVKTISGNNVTAGHRLTLNYTEGIPCIQGFHKRIENKHGIFLLTLNETGDIRYADFRSLSELPAVTALLKTGFQPDKTVKIIRRQNDDSLQFASTEKALNRNPVNSGDAPERKYYPLPALVVLLISGILYYILYKSRFKIR